MGVAGRPYLGDGSGSRLMIYRATPTEYAPFEPHHYLPGHAPATRAYLAEYRGEPAGWISLLRAVGHPGWRVHRLVVLPGARGRGIATTLVTWAAEHAPGGQPLSLRTRNRAFTAHLVRLDGWRPTRHSSATTTADRRTGGAGTTAWTVVYRRKALQDAVCLHCRERFPTTRKHARYCSTRCRVAAHRARASVITL